MSNPRIIATIIVRSGLAVQSIGFARYLPIGQPEIAARFFDHWGADEIVVVDIDATRERRTIEPALVARIAAEIYTPLAVGGGIRSLEDIRALTQNGADKVVINTASVDNPALIRSGAEAFGNQCLIVSIDARRTTDNHTVFVDGGRRPTHLSPAEVARTAEEAQAGEILLTSIDNDGAKQGYDLTLIRDVVGAVDIPVIAMGGAGSPEHIQQAFKVEGLSAAAASNFFHYTEHAIAVTKAWLVKAGIPVRVDAAMQYADFMFHPDGRLAKKVDAILEGQIFEHIREELI